ncbi:plant UBX domain-containing protein 2-like [Vicia villosa]|uniref:plant UBX domain-containing protein 2-like n=1 Tax=Vicia villosa TaxID=3911 RepID=UPI00273CA08D|nr:plant UBX domain-containing protein 2-like [Vicia villosa]
MDDVKDKMKGFMKKVNNPFSSSSSGKFKGQGRVLGSSSSSSSTTPPNSISTPRPSPLNSNPISNPKPKPKPKPTPPIVSASDDSRIEKARKPGDGFDPFDSLVTSSQRSRNGYSVNVYECPICKTPFRSEDEVSEHVESCLSNRVENIDDGKLVETETEDVVEIDTNTELEICVGSYVSGNPSEGSVDIVLKLLRNIVREPENVKFRKIRLSNPKIKEAVAEVSGGVELLGFLGFELKEENGETWAVMEVPNEEKIGLIKKAVVLLEPQLVQEPPKKESLVSIASVEKVADAEPKKIDRQVKVFFAVSESVASKIELPDSFYKRSVDEVRRDADLRRKKFEESQLLIPKSLKEKQAKAAKRRYTKTIIRIQFPDGIVLQGVFAPWEPTTALYEFVSSALKEQGLEFELMHPVVVQRRVIPCFPKAGQKAKTIEEEDLVPSALIKFKPLETDSVVFTSLKNELLEISEPLVNG